jgi:hypothetical protein
MFFSLFVILCLSTKDIIKNPFDVLKRVLKYDDLSTYH